MNEKMVDKKIKRLVSAMAQVDEVVQVARKYTNESLHSETPSDRGDLLYQEQESFASSVAACWNDLGPSGRYIKALVRSYVSRLEKADITVESDALMDLVLRASLSKDHVPDPNETCYLSFLLGPQTSLPLHIRIYPYHNDVALRLWEAGATLAEYFVDNQSLVAKKRVIELGAGVGLTGLVIAGCCGSSHVFITDYTEACRQNMDHNIQINSEWLRQGQVSNPEIAAGYLEWSTFLSSKDNIVTEDRSKDEIESLSAFYEADVLIAADVTYDVNELECLVAVVHSFLRVDPYTKQAIFGITRRNMATFERFLSLLVQYDVEYVWIADGAVCNALPKLFPCNFVQNRSDVRIVLLTIKIDQETET